MTETTGIDKSGRVREEDALPIDNVREYLASVQSDFNIDDDIEILQYPSGASNLTYEIRYSGNALILRTAPRGANIKSAHDMGREFKVLSKLGSHFAY